MSACLRQNHRGSYFGPYLTYGTGNFMIPRRYLREKRIKRGRLLQFLSKIIKALHTFMYWVILSPVYKALAELFFPSYPLVIQRKHKMTGHFV
jgi:hypothetical protein